MSDLKEMVEYLGGAVSEIDRLIAENKRLRAVLKSIGDLQDLSFKPVQDLISVAILSARNALKE